jgi:hypothetical protein
MTRNKKFSIINLIIYLFIFVGDVLLVGIVKDEMGIALEGLFGGAGVVFGDIASAVVMILAMLMLVICGVVSVVNVVLKILQINFDHWGFSVASVVLDVLVAVWTGIVTVSYLSGTTRIIGFICLGLFMAVILVLSLECVVIKKRKDV